LGSRGLSDNARPELVTFGEARLDVEVREKILDVGFVVAAVASVSRDAFAEELLDSRNKWVVMRELQVRECDVGGPQAASQRRGVVRLRVGNVLVRDLFLPVGICDLSLLEPTLCEVRIGPQCSTIAVQLRPVALQICQGRVKSNAMDYSDDLHSRQGYHSMSRRRYGSLRHDGP